MDNKWSQNDLIKENNDEQDIDKVNAPPLLAELEKNYKSKQKTSIAREFKNLKNLNDIALSVWLLLVFFLPLLGLISYSII